MKCHEVFELFSKLNVLVVGDIMLDRYWSGKVSRMSPEAPVPVVEWGREDLRMGGAANVALNILALGAGCTLCGVVGDDSPGHKFLELLPSAALDADGVLMLANRLTTVKTRILSGNQQLLRLDIEQREYLEELEEARFINSLLGIMDKGRFNALVLQDYNKGVLSPAVIRFLLQEAHRRGIPVAVDPKSDNFWTYRNVALFKPNLKEIEEALGTKVEITGTALRNAAVEVRRRLGNKLSLITLSEKGLYLDSPEQGQLYPTLSRTVADVCGAGDTVISMAALAMALQLPASEFSLLCNLAGGQVVEQLGTVTVDRTRLQEEATLRWPG